MQIEVKIITPERILIEDKVDSITLPAKGGEMTILPHHIPLVALLEAGVIVLNKGGVEEYFASSGGFVEILPESKVLVMADTSERAEELDLKIIEEAKKRAQEALRQKRFGEEKDYAEALSSLERELARLRALSRHRRKKHSLNPLENIQK